MGQIEQIESESCRLFWIGQTLRITDCSELEQSQCVRVRFRGSHLQAPEQYARLLAYIDAHALTPAGFSRELTMIDYSLTSDPEKFVTEITIPVHSSK